MFDIDADYQPMSFKYYIGGPLDYIAGLTIQAGNPVNPALATTLAVGWTIGQTQITLTSGSGFLTANGALCIVGTLGANWFTYESRSGTVFTTCRRIAGDDITITAASVATQWQDITDYVDTADITMTTGDVEGYYTMTLRGSPWNSLKLKQDASLLVQESHFSDTFLTPTPYVNFYLGFLGTPEPTATRHGTTFQVSVHGYWDYLKDIQITPKTYGLEILTGTRTASSTLGDVGTEPTEGLRPSDFNVNETADRNKYTLWISSGAPSNGTLLVPSGVIQGLNATTAGTGPRIQQVYCTGRNTALLSAQDQLVIEIFNNKPTGYAINGVIDKTFNAEAWTNYVIENSRGQRIYLWRKNGNGLSETTYEAQGYLYLVFNEKVAKQIFNFPLGSTIVEIGKCDGYNPGFLTSMQDPYAIARNAGAQFWLNPDGDWLAIRGKYANGNGLFLDEKGSGPQALVAIGGDGFYPGETGTITVDTTAGFLTKGFLHCGSPIEFRISYDGKDATHFYNCRKQNALNQIPDGQGLFQYLFTSPWTDFVGWGDVAKWGKWGSIAPYGATEQENMYNGYFSTLNRTQETVGGDDTCVNQNDSGYESQRCWGTRSNGDGTGTFTTDPAHAVNPTGFTGLQPGTSLRRKALAGGVYAGDLGLPGSTAFERMDGATVYDWTVLNTPIWGNPAVLTTVEWIKIDLGEHKAATVSADDDITSNNGSITITVGNGEAAEYAPSGYIISSQQQTLSGGGVGGGIFFHYNKRTHNEFLEVTKLNNAAGQTLTGSTLTQWVNVTPSNDHVAGPRWEAHNYYMVSQIDLHRWKNKPVLTILTDNSDINDATGHITLATGQGNLVESTGTIQTYTTQTYNNEQVVIQPAAIIFTYSGKSGDVLSGVVKTQSEFSDAGGFNAVSLTDVSYWTDVAVRSSRKVDPNDPLTYLGASTDWDEITGDTKGTSDGVMTIPFDALGGNHFVKWVFVSFAGMSDGGRVKVNSLNVYRSPKWVEGDDSDSSVYFGGNQTVSTIIGSILADANLPLYQRKIDPYAGSTTRSVQISSSGAAAAIVSLATKGECIVYEDMIGRIYTKDDPRIPGGTQQIQFVITAETVWGPAKIKQRPLHGVGQVILSAINIDMEEAYTVQVPNSPLPIGTVKRIDGKYAANLTTARNIATRIWRNSNGGWQIDIPLGHFYAFRPFDLVRVTLDADEAGIEMDRDFIITGYKGKLNKDGLTGILSLTEYVAI